MNKKTASNDAVFFVASPCLYGCVSAIGLEQAGRALAATHTHGDDAVTQVAPLQLAHQMADLTRAGHAERVADGNRATVDVVLVVVDLQTIAGIQTLRGEGFVELPQVDVGNVQALGLEQFRHREYRA